MKNLVGLTLPAGGTAGVPCARRRSRPILTLGVAEPLPLCAMLAEAILCSSVSFWLRGRCLGRYNCCCWGCRPGDDIVVLRDCGEPKVSLVLGSRGVRRYPSYTVSPGFAYGKDILTIFFSIFSL